MSDGIPEQEEGKQVCVRCGRQLNQHYTIENFCDGNSGPTFSEEERAAQQEMERKALIRAKELCFDCRSSGGTSPRVFSESELARELAAFALHENAELHRMIRVAENAFQLQEAFVVEGRAGLFNGLQIAKAWLHLEKRAETAEQQLRDKEGELSWLRSNLCDRHKDIASMSSGPCSMCAVADKERELAAVDDPALDATDGAHPAWWRGHDHTVKVLCNKVNDILEGKDDGRGVAAEPWEGTRRKLIAARSAVFREAAQIVNRYTDGSSVAQAIATELERTEGSKPE